jgi:copper chaperone CopZ
MENAGLIQEMRFQTNRKLQDVETELSGIDGIRSVTCDQDSKTISVQFDPTVVDENKIKQIAGAGTGGAGLGDLVSSNAEPVSGMNAGYGGADQSPSTQGRPPSTTI